MEIILRERLPATWLLQFDALVAGPFVDFLKANMAKDHEVGFWFEMNEKHCNAAGVNWRGRPGYEWDHNPAVAFTLGYTPAERVKLADTAMARFQSVWGRYPRSIASWNLDAITMAHLTERYGIDAYAVCRDQIATDGFTIWGAPIAGYYPSKKNCWSPAVSESHQIGTPVFRMLGQDPVYYYERGYTLPDGRHITEPDTMEPVWTSGRSSRFVQGFLDMISSAPTGQFAYAQLGQENSFPWPQMAAGYAPQMAVLAKLRSSRAVKVETMGESGRRFKSAFKATPVQAQVQLADPFDNTSPAQGSVWYQSRFYRANLHFKGDLPYLRDLTVYSDHNSQPFLTEATRLTDVEQRMPAVLDGYHWRNGSGSAGGYFRVGEGTLRMAGRPRISEEDRILIADLPVQGGKVLRIRFEERGIRFSLTPKGEKPLTLALEWDPAKSALTDVSAKRATYRWQGFEYSISLTGGEARRTVNGWSAVEDSGGLEAPHGATAAGSR